MDKVFCIGVALGMIGGALIVANSYKARSLVKKSQAEVLTKVNEMMDEKLSSQDQSGEGTKKSAKSK